MASSTPHTLKWGIMATGGIAQSLFLCLKEDVFHS